MILAWSVLIGLVAGLLRARWRGRPLQTPEINATWLALLACVPQVLTFHLASTSHLVSDQLAIVILVLSQAALLVFAWRNRQISGFYILGLGLLLNFLVIACNGGLMPIRPEAVTTLLPDIPPGAWAIGERLGTGKDVVLTLSQTRLWLLSDYFLTPVWFPQRVAFSLGDVLIAWGTIRVLWNIGADAKEHHRHYLRGSFA